MKKVLSILAIVFATALSAQYNRVAIGAELGVNAIGDQSATLVDAANYFGGSVRYSFNPITSIGLSGGWSNLNLVGLEGDYVSTNYGRLSTELYVDIFNILQLQNNTVTILVHGGGGFSRISTVNLEDNYQDNLFSATAGATALFKLNRTVALSATYRNTANITQDVSLDGLTAIENSGVNSTVGNFSAGLVFYFRTGPKGTKSQHADWTR